MTNPARSTALTANPGDFWYELTAGPNRWICSSTGFEFNRELGMALHEMNIPEQASYDGTRVSSASISHFNSEWGPVMNRLLWLAMKTFQVPPENSSRPAMDALLTAISSAGRAHLITQATLTAAAFVVTKRHFTQATDLTLGNVRVPADVIPPSWNTAPPAVSDPMDVVCAMSTPDLVDAAPVDAYRAPVINLPYTAAVPPPAPAPTPTTAGPITPPPPVPNQGSAPVREGLGWGAVGFGVVLTGILVGLGISTRNAHRKNPALQSDSQATGLQQAVMAYLHEQGVWSDSLSSEELRNGGLRITGTLSNGYGVGVLRDFAKTRQIARAHGFKMLGKGDRDGLFFAPMT